MVLPLRLGLLSDQAADVKKLLDDAKVFEGTRVIQDLAHLDRAIMTTRK